MAANDYYNHSSVGQSGRRYDYDAPLPPLPSSSPLYPTSKPTAGGNSLPPSPFEDPAYPPYPQHSQTSFGSDSGYYGAGSGERVQDSSAYADDRPLRPHRQKQSLEEWTGQNQQHYRLDDVGESVEPGKGRKGSRSRKKRSTGFFSGKIPWVVYLLTLVQAGVFIGELVKNSILTKSPIEIHPQFNPMIGPSQYVLINMGARFVPCMRNTAGVQDAKIAISWPCPNTTTLDPNDRSQHCKLSDLCGFSPVPNPKVGGGGAMTDSPEPNQWYRFIIPIFLHAGIIHIGFNMLLQLTLGREMEIAIGSWRFALVYFSSGIFGFVLGGNFAAPAIASTGASGSLFGILALTLLDLLYTWKEHKSPWKELAFIGLDVVISFVLGLLPGLDNFSHIGGFLMGLVLGICLLHSPNVLRQRIGGNEPPYAPVSTGRGKNGRVNTGVQDFVKRPLDFFKGRKPLWWAWWLVRAGALIGVTIGFIVLLNNFYRYKHTCGWCKYLSCLPINNWCSVGNINLTNTTQSSKRDLFSNAVTAPFYPFPSPYLEGLSQALAPYLRLRTNPTVPESTHGSVKNASESDQATQVDRAVADSLFSKEMATLAPSSSPSPPPLKRRRKTWARKCERYCCNVVTYLPLGFVYGLTTWAVWVEAGIGFLPGQSSWIGYASSSIGILLYLLLNWSYTTAVFTDPGSPLQSRNGYSHLPTQEPRHNTSFTVKSTGGARFCKKCQARKPDRAHHCSTCRRCVLKMDHHCPWLATCVGLRNYKSFLLFLVYTTFFCWICFAVTSTWVWSEVLSDGQYTENLMPVNYVLLAVISGIIGFVLTGFTAWHFSLAWRGQTTIECLEKTRYLSPLRRSMERQHYQHNQVHANGTPSYGQQLREIHANALPGVTRSEEGEETSSSSGDLERGLTAQEALRRTYNHRERSRERERYEDYLDEQDSEKLPNAFDHGWRQNLQHLFGTQPLFWFLPICNTSGDGWTWEPNRKWLEVRDQIRRQRELQWRAQERRERDARHGARNVASPYSPTETYPSDYRDRDYFASQKWQTPNGIDDDGQRHYLTTSAGVASVPASGRRSPGKADQILGRDSQSYVDGGGDYFGNAGNRRPDSGMSMETLRRRNSEEEDDDDEDEGEQDRYEVSSDEEAGDSRKENQRSAIIKGRRVHGDEWREW